MRLQLPQQIDRKQWMIRLGINGEMPEGMGEQLEQAERKLLQTAEPQGVYRIMGAADMDLPGSAIKKHLAECDGIIVMAVTLGVGIDRLIRTAQVRDMAEAVILDSGASILAEQCADAMEMLIRSENDGFMTGRYSPGYGDFPIEMQGQIVKTIGGPKSIGLTVNESCILIPRKSVTAVMGISDHPVTGYRATCEECLIKESCGLRKEGKQCWT